MNNMNPRRHFIKNIVAGSLGLTVAQRFTNSFSFTDDFSPYGNGPRVISTWNFGVQANAAAWEILKSGGTALDAVEAGVRIPEADVNERSVGYGGRP
ncbi:hypothetical protein V6O07_06935, partial [Arthrospira platensis SPKY2]